jgi:hypothetical protein
MTSQTQVHFSGEEFLQKLRHDEITTPIVFTGIVKKADEGADQFLFALSGNCGNWVKIPVAGIEKVEVLDVVACKDHTHPLVNLQFKRPQSEEGSLFLALAELSRVRGAMRPSPIADPAADCMARYAGLCRMWFKPGRKRMACFQRAMDMCDW